MWIELFKYWNTHVAVFGEKTRISPVDDRWSSERTWKWNISKGELLADPDKTDPEGRASCTKVCTIAVVATKSLILTLRSPLTADLHLHGRQSKSIGLER